MKPSSLDIKGISEKECIEAWEVWVFGFRGSGSHTNIATWKYGLIG